MQKRTADDWLKIAAGFEERWNLPQVTGAIDGKHIRIQCPAESGTLFHNYKGFYSIVLFAVCDANYCFTLIDVGQYGSNNDSGVLAKNNIGKMFEAKTLMIPPPSHSDGCSQDPLPFYLVGDETFPLKPWLMPSSLQLSAVKSKESDRKCV